MSRQVVFLTVKQVMFYAFLNAAIVAKTVALSYEFVVVTKSDTA